MCREDVGCVLCDSVTGRGKCLRFLAPKGGKKGKADLLELSHCTGKSVRLTGCRLSKGAGKCMRALSG